MAGNFGFAHLKTRTTQEKVLIILSALGFVSIFPFSIMRFWRGEMLIGVIDVTIAAVMLATCLYVLKTRKVRLSSIALAIFSIVGVFISVYHGGATQIYWAYPAILACYYLMPPKEALILSVLSNVITIGLLFPSLDEINFGAIVATQVITNLFAYVFSSNMHKQQEVLAKEARKDALTDVGNRRALDDKLNEILRVHDRTPFSIYLIMFDLDHFKAVNDRYGHRVGDEILKKVVDIIRHRIRSTDALYRFGGEEFVIVPLFVEEADALILAEELRELVERSEFHDSINVTISLGIAKYRSQESSIDWLERADKALYEAKNKGRNQSCMAK